MPEMEKVFKRIDGSRDEIIKLQTELTSMVALGPENGGTGEHEKSNYLKKKLEALSPDFMEEFRSPDEKAHEGYRPNLVARWEGETSGPAVWVLSHMDVVPPGDLGLWQSDPYKVKVDGDKNKSAVKKYGVTGYPTTLFLDSSGKKLAKIVGYRGPDAFIKEMKKHIR